MKEYKPFKSGKVRELYDLGDSLIMVCTDRISAFDNILENPIPKKGEVLNKMSKFWFDFTKDVVPNHMISIDAADMPAFFRKPEFDGNSMKTQKLEMIPEGLEECEKLPEAIFTPSTKAPVGEHDMNISMEEGAEWIEKTFPGKGKEYMERLRDLTLALYRKCADYALSKGIIIADTKFEFGLDKEGNIVLGDEMLTPDNSRFWPLDGYAPGKGQPSYDKQFVRDYLKENPGDVLPQEIIDKTIGKYVEAYELLTGEKF